MKKRMLEIVLSGGRATSALALVLTLTACQGVGGIDTSQVSPISNDDTYATLGYLWAGARSSIESKREPSTNAFNLQLSHQLSCSRGGQGAYQGTLVGNKSAGTGSAVLALTATLSECQFDNTVSVTTISATGFAVSGTVAVTNDIWGAINLRMVATTVTVNGKVCPGGVDVVITGTSPSSRPISTGTACGRTGAVELP